MKNDALERALEEPWKNKEKFYEDNKGLSMEEIIKKMWKDKSLEEIHAMAVEFEKKKVNDIS